MCNSMISLRKFLKLYLEIIFYHFAIWFIFIACGLSKFNLQMMAVWLLPLHHLSDNFTQGYMALFLCIPFLNVLLRNLNQSSHAVLIGVGLTIYSFLYQIPMLKINYNYLSWFIVVFCIAAYIRKYGLFRNDDRKFWGIVSVLMILLSMVSVVVCVWFGQWQYSLVGECMAWGAILTSVSVFMYFKNIQIPYVKSINLIASTTFGVFLIHAHSNTMRRWLWGDIVDAVGHYGVRHHVLYAMGCVAAVFVVCSIIDLIRIYCLEQPLFRFLDKRLNNCELYTKGWQP